MTWHTMRWVTAKLDDLKDQVEGVQTALNKCPGVLETQVGQSLQRRLEDNITSLEVTAALRQPAIQTRHWQQLITVAGGLCAWDQAAIRSGSSRLCGFAFARIIYLKWKLILVLESFGYYQLMQSSSF